MSDYSDRHCPACCQAVEIIGRRWTGSILQLLIAGASHFGEIEHAIPDISSRMLSERLKELEAEGIVERRVVPETPVRVEYRLTAKGRSLKPVLKALSAWADNWVGPRRTAAPGARSRAVRTKRATHTKSVTSTKSATHARSAHRARAQGV